MEEGKKVSGVGKEKEFFFFKRKRPKEICNGLVGSEMCIGNGLRDVHLKLLKQVWMLLKKK